MSSVNNVIIISTGCETINMEPVREFFLEDQCIDDGETCDVPGLLSDLSAGKKALEIDVWGFAFNYGDLGGFMKTVHAAAYEVMYRDHGMYLNTITVIVQRDHDDGEPVVYRWRPEGWVRYQDGDIMSPNVGEDGEL